jgi:hypothetical protein
MIQASSNVDHETVHVVISFRGEKVELALPLSQPLTTGVSINDLSSVGWVKAQILSSLGDKTQSNSSESNHIKLLYKGKILKEDRANLVKILLPSTGGNGIRKKTFRLVAMGVSPQEALQMDQELQTGMEVSKRLVRDDLTRQGQHQIRQRQQLGRQRLHDAAQRSQRSHQHYHHPSYGFGQVQVLPNLPQPDQAHAILSELANDPGILACMKHHHWTVPTLSELYPHGKVGESELCVMGLNKNHGQEICLRIRTDDLQGFRKPLSIRQVMYHELAHNVHSEHNTEFFQLMRRIEQECEQARQELEVGGRPLAVSSSSYLSEVKDGAVLTGETYGVTGGSYRLAGAAGGDSLTTTMSTPMDTDQKREMATRAALARLSAEERSTPQPEANCSCGREHNMFLPPQQQQQQQQQQRNNQHDTEQHPTGGEPMDESS